MSHCGSRVLGALALALVAVTPGVGTAAPGGIDKRAPAAVRVGKAEALVDELSIRFPMSSTWFSMVADMSVAVDPAGKLRPRYETATSARVIRSDTAGHRLRPVLPARADEPMRVRLEGYDGLWVSLRSLDAKPVPATVARGLVFYLDAMPEGDLFYKLTPTHVDEYLFVREPVARVRLRFAVELGPGVSGLLDRDRGIIVLDSDGAGRVRINRPFARGAAGGRNFGTINLEPGGNVMVLDLDLTGLEFPVLIDPDWTSTGQLSHERFIYTLVPLPDGGALAAGGCRGPYCPNGVPHPGPCSVGIDTDRYMPGTGTWMAGTNMLAARYAYGAALMSDGRVIVAGGCQGDGCSPTIADVEIYDPPCEFDPTCPAWIAAGALSSPRGYSVAVPITTGEVLFIGGCDTTGCTSTTDVYDPMSGTWSSRAGMLTPRGMHSAHLLGDGRVLVVGGCSDLDCATVLDSVEIYDPGTDSWSPSGTMAVPRFGHTTTPLCDGRAVITGGCPGADCAVALQISEIWNAGSLGPTSAMNLARHHHTATLMSDGRVLVVGGCQTSVAPGSASCSEAVESYDPVTGGWTVEKTAPGVAVGSGRGYHGGALLMDGDVLVAGGCNSGTCLYDSDLFAGPAGMICDFLPPPSDAGVGTDSGTPTDSSVPPGTDSGPPPGTDAGVTPGTDASRAPTVFPAPRCGCRVGVRDTTSTTTTLPWVALLLAMGFALRSRRLSGGR